VQSSGGDTPLDLAGTESQPQELLPRDHAVLSFHQSPDRRIPPAPIPRLVI
jgi:hypothetical protein